MSFVTNVMIQFHGMVDGDPEDEFDDADKIDAVQELACRHAEEQTFNEITSGKARNAWGGQKHPECDLWAAAFNYLDSEAFLEGIAEIKWRFPQYVRVFVQGQEDECFELWMFDKENKFRCVSKDIPPPYKTPPVQQMTVTPNIISIVFKGWPKDQQDRTLEMMGVKSNDKSVESILSEVLSLLRAEVSQFQGIQATFSYCMGINRGVDILREELETLKKKGTL